MADFSGASNEEDDKIKGFLKQVFESVQVSFIEQRVMNNDVNKEPEDEIKELVNMISEHENTLKELVELSFYLMQRENEGQHNMRDQNKQLENQIVTLETDIEFHKQSIEQYKRIFNDLNERNEKLEIEIQKQDDEVDHQKKENLKLKLQIQSIQNAQQQQPTEEKRQEPEQQPQDQQITDLLQEIDSLQDQLKKEQDIIHNLKKEMKEKDNNFKQERENLQIEIKDLKTQNRELNSQVEEGLQTIQELEDLHTFQNSQIEELSKKQDHPNKYSFVLDHKLSSLLKPSFLHDNPESHREHKQEQNLETLNTEPDGLYENNHGNLLSEMKEIENNQFSNSGFNLQDEIGDHTNRSQNKASFGYNNHSNHSNPQRKQSEPKIEQIQTKEKLNNSIDIEQEDSKKNTEENNNYTDIQQEQEQQIQDSNIDQKSVTEQLQLQAKRKTSQVNQMRLSSTLSDNEPLQPADLQPSQPFQKKNNQNESVGNNDQKNVFKRQKSQKIKNQPIRRDPYEEFFSLTSQCAKLNSQYMNDIIAIDTSCFYKQVRELEIPYYKWYKWIENKLHDMRLEEIKKEQEEIQRLSCSNVIKLGQNQEVEQQKSSVVAVDKEKKQSHITDFF